MTLKFRWPKLWPYCHLTNTFKKFGHVSVHYLKKGQSQWRICEGQSIFDSRTGGKKLQLHPLLKKKCAPAIFLRWKEFRMEICFSQKKHQFFWSQVVTQEKTPLPKNATSLTCSDRSVVADDVGRNSLVGWAYVQPPVKMKVMSP